uniref:Glycoside hydrolase and putative multidrug/cation efflux pump n=1 Tax=uncultured organism TaxID=155900 RepID=C8C0R9_9ZZZZ|nr:glycoside hydrolase and putative multidrug/cation efflux pump [uncultured organism]
MAAPVKIMERYGVRKVTKLTPEQIASACKSTKRTIDLSAFVLDMGQNLSGFPEITVRGKRGQKVTLVVAEALTEEGACNQRQTGRQHYYEYTLKGEGDETWRPRFSYYGYRYIQVEGAVLKGEKNPRKLPVLKDIQSCFVYNSAKKVSAFECSNPIFNAAHRLIEKAVRSNMQSVFTDCPHREKLGWLEQVHLNGPGLLYNYDLTAFAPQIMQNMADAQHRNGAMPSTAPEYVVFEGPGMDAFAESPEWGGALVIFPYMYYETYGDDSLIKKYYQNMRRYVDYLSTRADNHILSFGLGDWYDYGDFRAGFSRNTPVPLVADQINRYNMYSTAAVTCNVAPGSSSGEGIRQMESLIKEHLGDEFGYEWTSVAYQETQAGTTTTVVFVMALLVAFLVLAAQYESWTSPVAAVMGLPVALLGAMLGCYVMGTPVSIYTQIGIILLVALSAKNGILIVEFARDFRAQGNSIRDAAFQAGHIRLRPILMTSLAFVFGVMPLLFATGAGAGSRIALGAAVVFGMALNTLLATVYIPNFYELMQKLQEKFSKKQ